MWRNRSTIDEHTLAGYLAGDLTPARRRQVTRLIAEDPETRELVMAARELMDDQNWRTAVTGGPFTMRRLRLALWIASATMLVAAFAATTMMVVRLSREVSVLRSDTYGVEEASWSVDLAVRSGVLRWDAVPGATYAVVVWDPERGVEALRLPMVGQTAELPVLPGAEAGRPLSVWIEAIAPGGAVLGKTRPLLLTAVP